MKTFVIEENILSAVIAAIDNASHPNVQLKELLILRQKLATLPEKKEDGNSTHTADSQASC